MWSCHTFFSAMFSSYSFIKILFTYRTSQPFKTVHFNDSVQPQRCASFSIITLRIFSCSKFLPARKPARDWQFLLIPTPPLLLSPSICLFCTFHMTWEMHYVTLCDQLLLFDMRSSGPIHVAACISISLPFTEVCCCIVFIYLMLFIHSSCDGHLGWCHFSAIMNHAAVIIHVQVFMWHELLLLFGEYRGMEEPGYRATLFLTFWGTYQTVSSCTIFQFSR